jgi:tetratricopeptide (TPR) repeat protein
MTLIATSLYIFIKSLGQLEQLEIRSIAIALLSGYVSILITNFFGFSTVPVAILFFLFPALATSLTQERKKRTTTNSTPQHTRTRAVLSIMPWLTTCYLLMAIGRYWYADIKYNEGKNLNRAERYSEAAQALRQAVKLTPNEAIFHDELADSYSQIAQVMYHNNQADLANTAITLSIEEINKTTQSSPHDIKLLKTKTATLADLGSLNPQYYSEAIKYLEILKSLAPTEPTAHYRLALNHARLGDNEKAAEFLQEAILLKPDYEQARLFLGLLYEDLGEPEMAKEQYQYILDNINPNNGVAGDNLQELNKPQ